MSMITVWYKFLSAKNFSAIKLPGPLATVGDLKYEICEAKYKAKKDPAEKKKNNSNTNTNANTRRRPGVWNGYCLGTDHDLLIINPETNSPFPDDSALLINNSSVLLRRVPGDRNCRRLNTRPIREEGTTTSQPPDSSLTTEDDTSSSSTTTEEIDCHDFGDDVFAIPEEKTKRALSREEEDIKIMELVNTPALGITWTSSAGRASNPRKRIFPFSGPSRIPPDHYVCHRCGIKGHLIQDCPTNGDPNFDLPKRMKPTMAPDAAAESEFDRLMEGISVFSNSKSSTETTSSSTNSSIYSVPAELHCPICRSVMRDAVFVKRCCFRSFCKECIVDHVNKSKACACGADAIEDDFIPNNTVRKMISSFLVRKSSCSTSSTSSSSSVGSTSCCSTITM